MIVKQLSKEEAEYMNSVLVDAGQPLWAGTTDNDFKHLNFKSSPKSKVSYHGGLLANLSEGYIVMRQKNGNTVSYQFPLLGKIKPKDPKQLIVHIVMVNNKIQGKNIYTDVVAWRKHEFGNSLSLVLSGDE